MQCLGECSTLWKSQEIFGRELFPRYTGRRTGILLFVYGVTEDGVGRRSYDTNMVGKKLYTLPRNG